MAVTEIKVPDIGDFKDVPVIEVMVKAGDQVKPEDPLVTLESDKATMDVPAPAAGTVKEMKVKVGDKVSEGTPILLLDGGAARAQQAAGAPAKASVSPPPAPTQAPAGVAEVRVPDIGDFKGVPVIEVFVKEGATVKAEDARSEEHTSELQSRRDLVCRLLLEKKNDYTKLIPIDEHAAGASVVALVERLEFVFVVRPAALVAAAFCPLLAVSYAPTTPLLLSTE